MTPQMTVRQQIFEDCVEQLVAPLVVDPYTTFLRLTHAFVTGWSVHAFSDTVLVDGGQDKQIDIVSIDDAEGEFADFYILHAKNTSKFSSNTLIGPCNRLHWLFKASRHASKILRNTALPTGFSNVRLFSLSLLMVTLGR